MARVVLGVLAVVGFLIAIRSGFGLLWFVPYAAVGTVLIVRRPGLSIGWLLLAIGWLLVVQVMPIDATAEQFSAGTVPWPLLVLGFMAGGSLGVAAIVLFAYLAMVFPSGHLPGGRWGRVARILVTAVSLLVAFTSFGPTINVNLIGAPNGANVRNPFAVAPDAEIWQVLDPSLLFVLVISLLIGGAVSLVIRNRRARGVERQQFSWVVAAFAFVCVAIVSRTISWATVSVVLVSVFIVLVLVTQAALASITGSSTFAVAGSTLVVAALFQPLRRRVQSRVDRRFNRARYDAERTVTAFAGRLRDDVDLDQVRAAITSTIGRSVQPVSVSLWLRERQEAGPKASL